MFVLIFHQYGDFFIHLDSLFITNTIHKSLLLNDQRSTRDPTLLMLAQVDPSQSALVYLLAYFEFFTEVLRHICLTTASVLQQSDLTFTRLFAPSVIRFLQKLAVLGSIL